MGVYATTPSTLFCALQSLQLTKKKISFAASKQNKELHTHYMIVYIAEKT